MIPLRVAALVLALTPASAALAQGFMSTDPGPQRPQGEVPRPRQERMFPLGQSWTAVSLNGRPFSGDRPSFTLDQQFRARGFGGCNTYSATAYPLRQQGIAVGPFALTKRTCAREVMAIEQAFLVALRSAAKWEWDGTILTLKTQSGDLRFERAL